LIAAFLRYGRTAATISRRISFDMRNFLECLTIGDQAFLPYPWQFQKMGGKG
jgi:hypothetical protein